MFLTQVPKALRMRPEAQVWPYPGDTPAASVGGDTHRPCSGIRESQGKSRCVVRVRCWWSAV